MKSRSKDSFLREAAPQGLSLDSRYHPPQTLVFNHNLELGRSLDLPASPKDIPQWITSLVRAHNTTDRIFLYPRRGAWVAGDSQKLFLQSAIFASCGIAPRAEDVIEASEGELDAVESLILVSLLFGGTVSDDIFLVTDDFRSILYVDHHEAIHLDFCDDAAAKAFDAKYNQAQK